MRTDYLRVSMKVGFFDRALVMRHVAEADRRVLSRQGAFLRTRVRTDILRRRASGGRRVVERGPDGRFRRGRQRVARPGQPPIVRSRDSNATLKKILYAYDPRNHSVVVGPVSLNQRPRGSSARTVPELLEKGGTASVYQWAAPGSNVWNFGTWGGRGSRRRTVTGRYAPHPFMQPGLDKEIAAGNIIGPWAGAVK